MTGREILGPARGACSAPGHSAEACQEVSQPHLSKPASWADVPDGLLGHTPELNIGDGAELPAKRLSGILNGPAPTTLHVGAIAPHRGLALVVDDSPTVCKQLELSLQSLGIDVEVAEDGDIALHKIALSRYDIIFLDVVLPGADGYQICRTIKKTRQPEARRSSCLPARLPRLTASRARLLAATLTSPSRPQLL